MKTFSTILSALAVSAICAFSQTIAIGTNRIELVFDDATLPQANKDRLAEDLTEAFKWADSPSAAFDISPNASRGFGHVLEPFDMAMTSDLWDGVCLTNATNGLRCFVTRALSNAHAVRIARFSGHDGDISALRSRILAANSTGFDSLPLQAKADFFWHGGTVPTNVAPEQVAAFEAEIVPMLRGYVIHPPSIFRLDGPLTADGDTAQVYGWCVFVPRSGTDGGIRAVPAGLVNGQWKFYFGM